MTPVRAPQDVVIVGSGWARHAAIALASGNETRVTAIVARGSPRSMGLARSLRVPLVASVLELPAHVGADLAVVAVNEQQTPEIARLLLDRGAHVLCAHPVAGSVEEVATLCAHARARGLTVATDYTLALAPGVSLARHELLSRGPVHHVVIEHPGRLLPMAIHLARLFVGPPIALHALRAHPPGAHEAEKKAPAAYPPSLVARHASGALSVLVPIPHAAPHEAFRCTLSTPTGRYDLALPTGRLVRTVIGRSGAHSETLLDERCQETDPFGALMQMMARDFARSVRDGAPPACPLSEEIDVRAVWNAIPHALREVRPYPVGLA